MGALLSTSLYFAVLLVFPGELIFSSFRPKRAAWAC